MLRVVLAGLRARGLRLLLSGTAVVLGTAFVAGAFVLTDTLQKVFDDLFDDVSAGVDVVVRTPGSNDFDGVDPTVPVDLADRLTDVDGVQAADPAVQLQGGFVDPDGEAFVSQGPPVLLLSTPGDLEASPYTVREGRLAEADDELALDVGTAERVGYEVGDTVPVFTTGTPQDFTLVGVVGFGEQDNLAGAANLLLTTETALELSGTPDRVLTLELVAEDGVSQTDLRDRVAPVVMEVDPSLEVVTGAQQSSDAAGAFAEQLSFLTIGLLGFAGVALVVSSFLIVNTFNILVAQRVRELALLRAVGASRRQVTASVLGESAVLGLVAGALGLGLGLLLALALKALFDAIGFSLPDGPLVVQPRTVVVALLVGLVVTVLAAVAPALRAGRIPPVAALRDAALPRSSGRRSVVVGGLLLALGVPLLVYGVAEGGLALAAGCLAVFLGVVTLSSFLVRPLVGALGGLLSRGVPSRLGVRNTLRDPRRTATTAAALVVGVALVAGVSVFASSVQRSIGAVLEESFAADVALSEVSFAQQGISEDLLSAVAARDEVARVDPLPFGAVDVEGREVVASVLVPGALGETVVVAQDRGDAEDLVAGTVLLDDALATEVGAEVGDDVVLSTTDGEDPRPLRLAGTYETNAFVEDVVLLAEDAGGLLDDEPLLLALVAGADGVEATDVRAAVDEAAADFPAAQVQDRDDLLGQINSGVNGLLNLVYLLLGLSIVIAVLGVVNTLALAVVERTRELGLLRAVGLEKRGVRRMVRLEAVLIGVFGGVVGVALGVVLGVALQQAVADQGLDRLGIPWVTLLVVLVLSAVVGVVASLLPARRAARLDVLTAIRTE